MQLANNKKIHKLAGDIMIQKNINKIFDNGICEFLYELSDQILKNQNAKKYADLITFAFWIRKKICSELKINIIIMKLD